MNIYPSERFNPIRHLFVFGAVATVLNFWPASVFAAEITLCNNSSEKVWYSIAGFTSEPGPFQWRSIGWWSLEPDDCTDQTIDRLRDRHVFIHGQSDTGYWRGDYLFCVHDEDAFDVTGAYNCDENGADYEHRRFFQKTNLDGDGTFYVNFTD